MERHGADRNKTGCSSDGGSGFLSGPGSPSAPAPSGRTSGRRPSSVSDSGDTGFYTYSSDSVEDVSTYSQRVSTLHSQSLFVPGLSPVRLRPLPLTRSYDQLSAQQQNTAQWYKSCQQLTSALSPGSAVKTTTNNNQQQPIRKSSSLNKLSSWAVFDSSRTYSHNYNADLQGSLDRSLLKGSKRGNKTDFSLPLTSSFRCNSSLLRSPGSGPCYHYKLSRKSTSIESDLSGLRSTSAFSSPIKHNFYTSQERKGDDWNLYGRVLHEQPPFDSPLQPEVRTQMWLSEQMAYRPKFEPGGSAGVKHETAENYGEKITRQKGGGLNKTGIKQLLKESPVSVPGLVKFQEGLLRQREQEIDWQKQQIVQLQARITENELRVQQVQLSHRGRLEDHYIYGSKDKILGFPSSQDSPSGKDLNQKITAAEMELLHLKNVFKQVTQKYSEDTSKMEEKIQTRDRYITSLKKKCGRETEQKQEKHQRVETLESYLSDLPTLTEVHNQSQQLKEVQQKTKEMEKHASRLQKTLDQGQLLLREKYHQIEQQTVRERELLASVHSLQQKVQRCLEDGVRLPVSDLKQLEGEKAQLLEQHDYSSKVIDRQNELIEKLSLHLTQTDGGEMPEVNQLLRDMSVCVRDLQALGRVLVQRAQGQEPNLSVLLGIKSLSVSAEDSDRPLEEDELRMKLMTVAQLRRDIEELRATVTQPPALH